MARQFGVISSSTGLTDVVVQGITTNAGVDIAEARDESGKVIDLKAYSRNVSVQIDALLDAAEVSVEAGDTITVGGVSYLIESANVTESNTDFVRMRISARTADFAVLGTYSTGSN